MNKQLYFILLATILLVSLLSTLIVINKIELLKRLPEAITGYGTTGEIKLSITQNITLEVTQTLINFSSGYVKTGDAGAWLNSSATGHWVSNPRPNWINLSLYDPRPLEVRNDGNINLSLSLSSVLVAAGFIGGTSPQYQFNASNNESQSCTGTLAAWTNLNAGSQSVCTNFGAAEASDQIWVHCNLFIPSNAVGTKSDTWTFSGVSI